ncbi:hypothetical protein D1007_62057 [Hordeum vulgare]|nr:uncharacterized protein LOC123399316 [Hordeum vulgare subsp. vulgare]KAE8766688.1 hypothetical protein D1007_62057 [Hordeum vulgare]
MAASTVLALALAVLLLPAAASAGRAQLPGAGPPGPPGPSGPPGASPLVTACTEVPFPAHCVKELGPRLLDIQTALASVSPRAALIAGAPGTVDFSALVAVAMEAATEAGAVATTIFEGKLPGFNNSVPDFKVCLSNCSVTMKAAMKKLHGATAALKVHAHVVAKALADRAIVDVSACTLSCRNLTGDVRLILEASLVEFQKMIKIAVSFLTKIAAKTPPGPGAPLLPPPMRRP